MQKIIRKSLALTVWLALVTMTSACASEFGGSQGGELAEVEVTAAFAPVTSATFYDEAGDMVAEVTNPELTTMLEPGMYYVDIRDDHGNGVFGDGERLFFAPKVLGAEMDIAPHHVPGHHEHMIRIFVDNPAETHDGIGTTQQALHTFGGDTAAMRARLV